MPFTNPLGAMIGWTEQDEEELLRQRREGPLAGRMPGIVGGGRLGGLGAVAQAVGDASLGAMEVMPPPPSPERPAVELPGARPQLPITRIVADLPDQNRPRSGPTSPPPPTSPPTPTSPAQAAPVRALTFGPQSTLPNGVGVRDVAFETAELAFARQQNPTLPIVSSPYFDPSVAPTIVGGPGNYAVMRGGQVTAAQTPAGGVMPNPNDPAFWQAVNGQMRFNGDAFGGAMQGYQAGLQNAANQARLDLARQEAFGGMGLGGQFVPGRLQTDALQAANAGRAAEIQHGPDAVNERNFSSFLQATLQQGGTIQDARRRWAESGLALPPSQGGSPQSPASFGAPTATTGATTVAPTGPQRGPTPVQQSPETVMEQVLAEMMRAQTPLQGATGPRPLGQGDVASFIQRLPPGFLDQNIQQFMPFMIRRFGPQVMDQWFTGRSWRGSSSPDAVTRQAVMNAVNRVRPGTVGGSIANPQSPWWTLYFGGRER